MRPLDVAAAPDALLQRGGSAVIAPDGQYIVSPAVDEETIITAELDLSAIDREIMTLDVPGHYHRPDVFDVTVHRHGLQCQTPDS